MLPPDPHDTPDHQARRDYDDLDRPTGEIDLIDLLPVGCEVSDESIHRAAARFKKKFPGRAKLHERVDRAVEILEARDERLEFQLEHDTILVHGTEKRYRVQANQYLGFTCGCRDFWVAKRQKDHLGMCKHVLAVELLRDAERIEEEGDGEDADTETAGAAPTPDPQPEPEPEPQVQQLARVDVAGRDLFAMLGHLLVGCAEGDETTTTLYVSREGFLTLDRGRHSNTLRQETSGGAICLLSGESFDVLWGALRPTGVNLPTLTMGIYAESGTNDGVVIIKGGPVDLVLEAQTSPA